MWWIISGEIETKPEPFGILYRVFFGRSQRLINSSAISNDRAGESGIGKLEVLSILHRAPHLDWSKDVENLGLREALVCDRSYPRDDHS